jgi:hypothetical protein
MKEAEPGFRRAFDEQLPSMDRTVMSAAQHDQVGVSVRSAVRAKREVMDVDESGVSAARYDASPMVASHHSTAGCGAMSWTARSGPTWVGRCCVSHAAMVTTSGSTAMSSPAPCSKVCWHWSQVVMETW